MVMMYTELLFHLFVILSLVHAASSEEWVKFSLETQRNLISSYSIDKAPLIGTHNSYLIVLVTFMFNNRI